MKTIFTKYNRERLPRFQIATKIIRTDAGGFIARKEPLSADAIEHIQTIYNNHSLLSDKFTTINLCQPALADNAIEFEFINGNSFEKLLKEAINCQNKMQFMAIMHQYIAYVSSFISRKQETFVSCDKFKEVFGEWEIDEPQDIIDIANFDMNFSNLIISDNGITQIDYEWVFAFPIPISLLFYRIVFDYLNGIIKDYKLPISHEEIFALFNLNFKHFKHYGTNIAKFYQYVYDDGKYGLNNNVLLPISDVMGTINMQQLFVGEFDNVYSEDKSLRVSFNYETTQCTFDVSEYSNIHSLRFDPINRPAKVKLLSSKLLLGDEDESVELAMAWHNGIVDDYGYYDFKHSDPQIIFSIPEPFISQINKVVFEYEIIPYNSNQILGLLDDIWSKYQSNMMHSELIYQDKIIENKRYYQDVLEEKEQEYHLKFMERMRIQQDEMVEKENECLANIRQNERLYQDSLDKKENELQAKLKENERVCHDLLIEKEYEYQTNLKQNERMYQDMLIEKDKQLQAKLNQYKIDHQKELIEQETRQKKESLQHIRKYQDEMLQNERIYKKELKLKNQEIDNIINSLSYKIMRRLRILRKLVKS